MKSLHRALRRLALLTAAAGASIAVVAATGEAAAAQNAGSRNATTTTTFAVRSRPMVQAMLTANPGARRVDATTVQLANGVVAKAIPDSSGCQYKYLCIFPETSYNGPGWALYNCGFVNVGLSGWSNRLRSFMNEQTEGTVSIFYDWNASAKIWVELGASSSYDAQPAPTWLYSTDGIHVC
jgi:hypothetical protein